MSMAIFSRQERDRLFPIFKRFIYLNTASTGILPEVAIAEMEGFLRRYRGERIRHDAESFRIIADTREKIAALTGTSAGRIALVINTSFGINVAANGLKVPPGRAILLAPDEFPANFYPWQEAARRRGIKFEVLPEPDESLFDRPDAGVIAVSWVRFFDGFRYDLSRLSDIARRRGAFLCVDGIQGAGNLAVNLDSLNIATFAAGGQKWLLSPYGTGFLYVSPQAPIEPQFVGWLQRFAADGDYSSLRRYDLPEPADATRFELGTLPYHNLWAMWKSVDLLYQIGIGEIEKHNLALAENFAKSAAEIDGIRVISEDGARRSSIVSITAHNPQALHRHLAENNIICAFREGNIRFSFHIYNDEEQVEKVVEEIKIWAQKN